MIRDEMRTKTREVSYSRKLVNKALFVLLMFLLSCGGQNVLHKSAPLYSLEFQLYTLQILGNIVNEELAKRWEIVDSDTILAHIELKDIKVVFFIEEDSMLVSGPNVNTKNLKIEGKGEVSLEENNFSFRNREVTDANILATYNLSVEGDTSVYKCKQRYLLKNKDLFWVSSNDSSLLRLVPISIEFVSGK
jgi:hypothetical protein